MTAVEVPFTSVYGPVSSWRFGRSLGIDIIGNISTCSFNCVYCQLGEIQHKTLTRQEFVPTAQILDELASFAPWDVDVITFSGSGEPTLAVNLEETITAIKRLTDRPIVVLTNSTLLHDPEVQQALFQADLIAAKFDAAKASQLHRVNRPIAKTNLNQIVAGICEFRQGFCGKFTLQTMILSPWDESTQAEYIRQVDLIKPDEIHFYIPTRPRPLIRQLEARGNHSLDARDYPTTQLKIVSEEVLATLARRIEQETQIPVRYAPIPV